MRSPFHLKFPRPFIELTVCILFVFLAVSVCAQTQITTGTVQGTVEDEHGAVVPGATVEVKNVDTNLTHTLTTDDGGRFVFLQLPPGRYTLTVSKQGFATLAQEEFALTVGQAATLDLKMKVSQVAETVNVSAVQTVDTASTQTSTTIDEKSVGNLPVLGRKFEDLLTLTPNVSITQGPDGDEINFAGQRGVFNNISLDGGDYMNGFFGEQAGGQRAAIDIPLDAVREFQVVATGATAEFGRTASGVVNVVTKSGTNEFHGSLFYFQRLQALTAHTSDGKPLTDFHREQLGGNSGGTIKKDKAFFFVAAEQIFENLTRANLSDPIGSPCPVSTPTIAANEALINSNTDCQRIALINFFKATRSQDEGLPIKRPIRNTAILGKVDWDITKNNRLTLSHNFDYSKNTNQTFDVATYGDSANGIEGPSKIHAFNANLFTTLSPTVVNEAHFTYGRELRPRSATPSKVPADTAMGFATTFRFGNPFFLAPNGFGPTTLECVSSAGAVTWVTAPAQSCPAGAGVAGPLLLYLQDGTPTGIAGVPPPGASSIKNEDLALFAQDKWQIRPNLTFNYGLRWEAQIFPKPVIDPSKTAYGPLLGDPRFPSDGTLHSPKREFQPRVGFAWDVSGDGKSVLRANFGVYYARQNMLSTL